MIRAHLAAAVLAGGVLVSGTVYANDYGRIEIYSGSLSYGGGSWETLPTEFVPRYDDGYTAGYPIGYQSGFGAGQVRGRAEGWANGKAAGHSAGWDEAYPLAFDLAYDEAYPAGHFAGWESGLGEGFEEGYDYAPVVAATILRDWYGGGGVTSFGMISINTGFNWGSGTILGANYTVWRDSFSNDWSKLAYDEGFKVGKTEGYSAGSTDGYDDTYGPTYDMAFPIGHQLGIWEGTSAGKRAGREEGREAGWDAGYELGFDEGFYAGIDYRIFGDFVLPQYSLAYTRRGSAETAAALVAMNAPEPACSMMMVVGGVLAATMTRRSRVHAAKMGPV